MRTIDKQTWLRRTHFEFFNRLDYPHFNICANVDISALHPLIKQRKLSFNITLTYLFARVANAIPEFRYRIHGEEVVEHDIVHPANTIMTENDLFSFCTFPFTPDFDTFNREAINITAYTQQHPTLEDPPGQDDLLFMTSIPWVSFTSMTHTLHMHPVDSVPRISWGKFFSEGKTLKMPLSVQVHHALMDGVHVGRYFNQVEDYLNQPELIFQH